MRWTLLLATTLCLSAPAWADPVVHEVAPTLETRPHLPDNAIDADGDDPAIWIAPNARLPNLVVTAVKDAGIRVYDLKGKRLQVIDPVKGTERDGRINNVDIAYGVKLKSGKVTDIVVASDRGLDTVRFYLIDATRAEPLVDITAADAPRAFPQRPRDSGSGLVDNPLDDQHTVYGLTVLSNPRSGKPLIVGTQRGEARIGVFGLDLRDGDKLAASFLYDHRVPVVHKGQNLREENDDPYRDWSPQFEGLVVDQRTGVLYAGQEDVGIWRVDLGQGASAKPRLVYETRGSKKSRFHNPKSVIARDVEGLTIYHAPKGRGYLLASSQGGAHGDTPAPDAPYDDSFVVFQLDGKADPKLVGSFRVGARRGIDAVQESDGADVVSNALPGFPNGLFVTQDGYDDDLDGLSGETSRTNFKYVTWEAIAKSFKPSLAITPNAFNPRKP